MKLKNLTRTIVVIAMMLIGFLPSMAYDFQSGGIYYDIILASNPYFTVKVIDALDVKQITIPEAVTYSDVTYKVVAIDNSAFENNTKLNSIELPNTVTSIGDNAFYGCTNLLEIEIPNSVTSIGSYAFYGCSLLWEINLPSIASIKKGAFMECSNLKRIEIPNSVKSIEEKAFYNCSDLKSLKIGNSITTIGNSVFCNCTGLTSVEIPNSVTSIGNNAFYACTSLTDIKLSNSVASIGDYAFFDCNSLTSIEIPISVKKIGKAAFAGKSLKSITWSPAKCEFTENQSPFTDTSVSNIVLNDSYGSKISTIIFTTGVEYIPPYICQTIVNLSSVEISETVKEIGTSAFENCKKLISVDIPISVISIGNSAFSRCSSLTDIKLPNSVASIGASAFYCCSSLTEIELPSSIKRINYDTFAGCSELEEITIPHSVTYIGSGAFATCKSLKVITLGENLSTIEKDAFSGCKYVEKIECYAETPPSVDEICQFENSVYRNTPLFVPKNSITKYQSDSFWKRFENIRVFPWEETKAVSISLNKSSIRAEIDTEYQLMTTILPYDTTNKTVVWTSSNEEVATVSSEGLVKVLKEGVATITATTTDGTNLSASCEVTCLSGIDEIGTGECYVAIEGNNIKICNTSIGTKIRVYSTNGILIVSEVATTSKVLIPIEERGIYIVSIGNKKVKAIL